MGSTVNKSCKKTSEEDKTTIDYVFRKDILPGHKECAGGRGG